MLCQLVIGPQFHNFTLKCCFLTWRRASKNFERYPKISKEKNLFIFKPAPGGMSSFIFLKAKNKKILKIIVSFVQVKDNFGYFRGPHIFFKIFNFEFSFWRFLFEVKERYLKFFIKM